jgi:hypothetical protein
MKLVDNVPMPRPRQKQVSMVEYMALVERVKELEDKIAGFDDNQDKLIVDDVVPRTRRGNRQVD